MLLPVIAQNVLRSSGRSSVPLLQPHAVPSFAILRINSRKFSCSSSR